MQMHVQVCGVHHTGYAGCCVQVNTFHYSCLSIGLQFCIFKAASGRPVTEKVEKLKRVLTSLPHT